MEDTVYEGMTIFASARLDPSASPRQRHFLLKTPPVRGRGSETANQASESIQVLASYTLKRSTDRKSGDGQRAMRTAWPSWGTTLSALWYPQRTETLDAADVAKITDIAMTETGYAASAIRIMAAN